MHSLPKDSQTNKRRQKPTPALKSTMNLPAAEEPVPVSVIRQSKQIIDYISGRTVIATPEEIDAVQVFSRRLVEELGYSKELIQTRPQFRVRPRPSESITRGYPVDIAVFTDARHLEDDTYILVECKQKTS
jgi:Type I restriction enzyme R protein N terminus (HSDR_N)